MKKFKRSWEGGTFIVTFYWCGLKVKTFKFHRTYEGSMFVVTDTQLNGYHVPSYSYKGHGRRLYL